MSEETIPETNGLIQNGEPVPAPKPNKYGKITYNKDGTPRKQLSQEALEKLAKARQAAKKYYDPNKNKKIEKKIADLKSQLQPEAPPEPPPPSPPEPVAEPEPLDKIEEEEQEEQEVKVIKKATGKKKSKKPVIIVEQDESDEDEFADKDNVIFVKRAGRVKREKAPEPELPPSTIPQPPPKPQMTAEQIKMAQQYEAMFSGQFMQGGRRRF
tara:strand:+ start:74 stop:709 length:636 start_codon:yes stop_codon:yes gene_type:complete